MIPPNQPVLLLAEPPGEPFSWPGLIYSVGETFYAASVQFRPVVDQVVQAVGDTTTQILNAGVPAWNQVVGKTKQFVYEASSSGLNLATGAWKTYLNQFGDARFAFFPNYIRNQTKNDLKNHLNKDKPQPQPSAKHFKDDGFAYNWKGTATRINDSTADQLIEAYETLRVDVVKFVLEQRQLPDFHFIKQRYKNLEKIYHPDKGGNVEESIQITSAYGKIKNLMTGPDTHDEQFALLSSILRFFHKGTQDSLPYIILFVVGGAGSMAVMYRRRKK